MDKNTRAEYTKYRDIIYKRLIRIRKRYGESTGQNMFSNFKMKYGEELPKLRNIDPVDIEPILNTMKAWTSNQANTVRGRKIAMTKAVNVFNRVGFENVNLKNIDKVTDMLSKMKATGIAMLFDSDEIVEFSIQMEEEHISPDNMIRAFQKSLLNKIDLYDSDGTIKEPTEILQQAKEAPRFSSKKFDEYLSRKHLKK